MRDLGFLSLHVAEHTMIAGLAMPNWVTGLVGLARAEDEEHVSEIVDRIYYTCYVQCFDMAAILPAKRTCVVRVLREALTQHRVSIKLVYADPYGIVNKVCTELRVNRNLVFPQAFKTLFRALREQGLLSNVRKVYLDRELSRYIQCAKEILQDSNVEFREDSPFVRLATLAASILDVSQTEYRREGKYVLRVGDEYIELELVDIYGTIYDDVMRYARSLVS